LFELFDDITAYGIDANRDLLKKLPRDREVMSDRYGLRGTPSLLEAFDAYRAALALVGSTAGKFAHKYYVGGAGFLLRKPPWTTLPSTTLRE
jgi:hypothetical protein